MQSGQASKQAAACCLLVHACPARPHTDTEILLLLVCIHHVRILILSMLIVCCCVCLCLQALVQYPDEGTADQAKEYLDGHCMYPNNRNKVKNSCCPHTLCICFAVALYCVRQPSWHAGVLAARWIIFVGPAGVGSCSCT
jgi:hypothetical protein